jgi:membrane protease YdiL (CAAX protease family)
MEQENELKTWSLVFEALILFVGLPLLVYWELIPLPKILLLILVAGYCGYRLWRDPSFGRGLLTRESSTDASKSILIRTPVVIAALVALIWVLHPDRLFAFPAERPIVWVIVMILYPLLSALPQEFIYRTYFFHRYEDLISLRYAPVISSAVAFSFMHIIYDNWWAIGISFIGGLLFGITYARTKSLFWVTVEHAIYGGLVFTLGLGIYFYEAF